MCIRDREFAGGECEFSWKNHSGESSENFWLEKTRCEAAENETGRSETIINEAELAAREDIVFDPQTSGGLLLSIDSQDAGKAISRLSSLSLPCAVIGRCLLYTSGNDLLLSGNEPYSRSDHSLPVLCSFCNPSGLL